MATSQISGVIQHLRRAALLRDGAGLTDGQLLTDYLSRRDEAALAALVHRHAPMVWGVCRRVLRNHHDAEDAFRPRSSSSSARRRRLPTSVVSSTIKATKVQQLELREGGQFLQISIC